MPAGRSCHNLTWVAVVTMTSFLVLTYLKIRNTTQGHVHSNPTDDPTTYRKRIMFQLDLFVAGDLDHISFPACCIPLISSNKMNIMSTHLRLQNSAR